MLACSAGAAGIRNAQEVLQKFAVLPLDLGRELPAPVSVVTAGFVTLQSPT